MATDEVPKTQGASVSRTTTFMKFHNVMYCNLYTLQAIGGNDPSLSLVTVHVRFPLNFFLSDRCVGLTLPFITAVLYSVCHIGLYRDVWIAAIASSTTSLATRTAAICVRCQGRRVRRVYVTMEITFLTRKSALIYRRGYVRESPASLSIAMAYSR